MSKEFKEGLLFATLEYLLVVIPIAIFVLLESIAKHKFLYFFTSPEWAVATIFLSFVGIRIYRSEISSIQKKISPSYDGLLGLSTVIIAVTAIIISFLSLQRISSPKGDSDLLIGIRISLFIITSCLFFLGVAGARTYKLKNKPTND